MMQGPVGSGDSGKDPEGDQRFNSGGKGRPSLAVTKPQFSHWENGNITSQTGS